jgi:hypothetical protein
MRRFIIRANAAGIIRGTCGQASTSQWAAMPRHFHREVATEKMAEDAWQQNAAKRLQQAGRSKQKRVAPSTDHAGRASRLYASEPRSATECSLLQPLHRL